MTRQVRVIALLAGAAFGFSGPILSAPQPEQRQSLPDHTAWVANALQRMLAIKPEMTRADLLTVFTTEGGLSTGLNRTFVSRDCPYFKVDVEFQAVGRSSKDDQRRVTLTEDSRDIIVKISRPYLAYGIGD
jgi:hypothetical protein